MSKAPKDDAPALEWALFYASLGWAVFPIQPREKAAFYNYPEYKDPETGNTYSWKYQATKNPQRIEIFWTEHPDANIGVATGTASDLYVLDLDIEKPGKTRDGRKHFIEWQKKRGENINTNTPVSKTGSGGNQIFYTCDEKIFNNGAQIYKGYGVDRRGEGGYCVLPPSIHPNGKRYTWKQSPTEYKVQRPNITAFEYMGGLPAPEHEPIEYAQGYEIPEQITEGGRTDELIRYTGQIIAKNPSLTEDQIKDLIKAANLNRCKPPLDERELAKQVYPSIRRFKSREQAPTTPAVIDPAEYMRTTAASYIDTFWDDPANLAAPIPTGYSLLDRQLDGGLYTGLYVIGALSTMGKTTFTLQMANQMAQAGHDILFFSLEMSRAELIAKSLSNLTATIEAGYIGESVAEAIVKGGLRNAKTARALTDPERIRHFTDAEQALIIAAKELYKREYGGRIWIIEGEGDIGPDEIRDRVNQHKEITGKTPIIFVDYLQILRTNDPRLSDKQRVDEGVVALRRIARANNTIVFAISSLNRGSYSKDIDMDAFKESGAIEYSSDGLLGLQPRNMGETAEKSDLIKDTKRAQVRQLELRILKNRGGLADGTQQFYYTPAFNTFEDVKNEPIQPKAKNTRPKQDRPNITLINDKMNALLQNAGIPWPSEGVMPDDVNPFLENDDGLLRL